MSRQVLRTLAAGVASVVVFGALAGGAGANFGTGWTEIGPLGDGEYVSLGPLAGANVGGNPFEFLLGCNGHPAVGTIAGYENETSAVLFKLPSAGGQPQVLLTQGSISPPSVQNLVNKGSLVAFAAGQQPTVGTIGLANGNFVVLISLDPKAFPGLPWTQDLIADNIKNSAGSPLAGSPIVSVNPEFDQLAITGQPNPNPPRFQQPFHWDCAVVSSASMKARTAEGEVAKFAGIAVVPAVKPRDNNNLRTVGKALDGGLVKVEAEIQQDDYLKPAIDAAALLPKVTQFETIAKTVAREIKSPAARRKFLKNEQKAAADTRAALAATKGLATVT